ncbi:nucleotidyltransferase domain-containing protein [Lelliottia sp. WAP21]|uniref:nucleotidyltransferase domain-containing protein n=1 Tax=Lelliottia sp. WAP21 TaxID=2877426 RepID=UPI001E5B425F|nr:nucleotidyltransferase domain-containing protein [Lelliottia sp. WAP21]
MYASVKFGSLTKGLADKYSDNDLLVVCPDRDRKIISEDFNFAEYNISFFSSKQLHLMRDKGSLFLQHIKRDGVIIFDEGSAFASFLNNCRFIAPDDNEIKRCESTLSFIRTLPEERILNAWKADFIYCVSRDYLIKKLAMEGFLAFSIDEIMTLSLKCFDFKMNDFDKLKKLRKIKAIYRSELTDSYDFGDISSLINNWLNILNLKFNFTTKNKRMNLIGCLFKADYSSTYEALRCLEALYILLEKKGINHIEHHKIIKYIKSPNLYGSLQSSKKTAIRKYLHEIYSFF